MAEHVQLIGAEEVQRASHTMARAAAEMTHAASNISSAMESHQRFMDDWLSRFEQVLSNDRQQRIRQG